MKNNFISLFLVISGCISGCATVPKELTPLEREKGLTVYRQNTYVGAASTLEFEVNGEKYKLGPSDVVHIKPNIGENTFALIHYQLYGAEKVVSYEPQKYIFRYQKDEVVRLGVAYSSPTVVDVYSANGTLKKNYKFEYLLPTSHIITANPGNVIVSMVDKTFNIDKKLIDDSKKTSNLRKTRLTFLAQPEEARQINISVKWLDFDEEVNYVLDLQGGVHSEKTVEPSKESRKYMLHLASKLNGVERVEFLCKNELLSEYKNNQICITKEMSILNRQQQVEKENEYKNLIQSMLESKEGAACAKKFNGYKNKDSFLSCYASAQEKIEELKRQELLAQIKLENEKKYLWSIQPMTSTSEGTVCLKKFNGMKNRDAFESCYRDAAAKSEAQKKFTDASNSKEGAICLKKSVKDNDVFWNCYQGLVATADKLKNDDIAQQCIKIGFEYQTKEYSDCYLKLKIHTEQIVEWKKIQSSIESQRYSGGNPISNGGQTDSVERNLEIARRGFDSAYGASARPVLQPPPPPARIVTPMGNSYNCSMMGASLRCR